MFLPQATTKYTTKCKSAQCKTEQKMQMENVPSISHRHESNADETFVYKKIHIDFRIIALLSLLTREKVEKMYFYNLMSCEKKSLFLSTNTNQCNVNNKGIYAIKKNSNVIRMQAHRSSDLCFGNNSICNSKMN